LTSQPDINFSIDGEAYFFIRGYNLSLFLRFTAFFNLSRLKVSVSLPPTFSVSLLAVAFVALWALFPEFGDQEMV